MAGAARCADAPAVTGRRAAAHAKVNLALAVTGRRRDGYHTLRSVFLRVALHDQLSVTVRPEGTSDVLEVEGDLVAGEDNLVLRAASALRDRLGLELPPLAFHLRKRVPAAAGLGGGSADAAAAIELALAAWGVSLDREDRLAVALGLGADVPFFTVGHAAALVEGIGELVTPLPAPHPPAGLLLVTPRERLATADVFAEFDRDPRAGAVGRVDALAEQLRRQPDGAALAAASGPLSAANDLWASAARRSPGLTAARDALAEALGRPVLLTGSGPTLVAVYASEADAVRASTSLQARDLPGLAGAEIRSTRTLDQGELA
jgi:4-diphosphocytidyl-2-C-methyl-D-erythritol kinase